MCDTPSHGSDHLWLIWKESIQNCRCYRADTAGGTDGRTDGRTDRQTDRRTDGVKPIYPPTTSLFGGYNNGRVLYFYNLAYRKSINVHIIVYIFPLLFWPTYQCYQLDSAMFIKPHVSEYTILIRSQYGGFGLDMAQYTGIYREILF